LPLRERLRVRLALRLRLRVAVALRLGGPHAHCSPAVTPRPPAPPTWMK
jgi:hypothetical protein